VQSGTYLFFLLFTFCFCSDLNIGSIELDVPIIQAALAGYSDLAMRSLARRFGAPLTFSGVMIDSSAAHPAVARKLKFHAKDDLHPIGGQIVGTEPKMMTAAARALLGIGYDLIDLNFACPAPKVLRRGRGGSMLADPNGVIDIFRRVREAVSVPLTIKLRIGCDSTDASREDFWQIVETVASEGADALIIHGRTVEQYYRGRADWSVIAEVKKRFPRATVIGSGDIFTANDIVNRLRETGIDGISVARGAIGNPWIFTEARALLEGKPLPPPPSVAEQGRVMLGHFEEVLKLHGARKCIGYFRKFSAQYAKHHPDKRHVHRDLMTAGSPDEFRSAVAKWYS
jgi:tRNA-dihydrouridine synthase B